MIAWCSPAKSGCTQVLPVRALQRMMSLVAVGMVLAVENDEKVNYELQDRDKRKQKRKQTEKAKEKAKEKTNRENKKKPRKTMKATTTLHKKLHALVRRGDSNACADCFKSSSFPTWASTNLGCYMCLECSGIHRAMGTHVSKIKSLTLDQWTPAQVARMETMGNAKTKGSRSQLGGL